MGFTLPWFARRSDRSVLRWSTLLLAMPSALYLLAVIVAASLGAEGGPPSGPPEAIIAIISAIGSGGLGDAFVGNLVMLAGRWAEVVISVRLPKVLGMFLLGLWVVRHGVLADPAAHRPLLTSCRRWGLGAGLPINVFAAWATTTWPYESLAPAAFLGVVGQGVGYPLLAIGYASTVALAVTDAGRLGWMAPVGRMALTNYLTHSLVCVTLSYGFGFGLWWQVGASTALAIGLAIVAVQIPLSRWWLTRYRLGPAEWLWRRLTYRQPLPMRV